jgi:ATP synthase F1 epsilon subunit
MAKTCMLVTMITPQGFYQKTEALEVQIKTEKGPTSILVGHAPMMAILKPGRVKIIPADKKTPIQTMYLEGSGVLQVQKNQVTILADNGFYAHQLDSNDLKSVEIELRKKLSLNQPGALAETLEALNEVSEKLRISEEIRNESTQQ